MSLARLTAPARGCRKPWPISVVIRGRCTAQLGISGAVRLAARIGLPRIAGRLVPIASRWATLVAMWTSPFRYFRPPGLRHRRSGIGAAGRPTESGRRRAFRPAPLQNLRRPDCASYGSYEIRTCRGSRQESAGFTSAAATSAQAVTTPRHPSSSQHLPRYANGKPITKKRYDYLWRRLGEHLAWVETLQVSMYWRIKRVSKSFVTVDHGHPPLILTPRSRNHSSKETYGRRCAIGVAEPRPGVRSPRFGAYRGRG